MVDFPFLESFSIIMTEFIRSNKAFNPIEGELNPLLVNRGDGPILNLITDTNNLIIDNGLRMIRIPDQSGNGDRWKINYGFHRRRLR